MPNELQMVHCKHCGKPLGHTEKKVCPDCMRDYHTEKSRQFQKDKDLVRGIMYRDDREMLNALAKSKKIAVYDLLHTLIKKEFAKSQKV